MRREHLRSSRGRFSGREFEQDAAIVSVETLAGRELEYYFRNVNDGYESLSPSPRLFITQDRPRADPRSRAEELSARLEYSDGLRDRGDMAYEHPG